MTGNDPSISKEEGELSEECQQLLLSLPKNKSWSDHIPQYQYQYQGFWCHTPHVLQAIIAFQNHFQARDSDIVPLFPGESGVDQLVEIIKILGTPTREEIKCMNPNYTEYKFPQIKAHPWHKIFYKQIPPEALDLVSRLLQYSPNLRCTALEACAHPFFDDLRDADVSLPNGRAVPALFDFTAQELAGASTELRHRLIPEHART